MAKRVISRLEAVRPWVKRNILLGTDAPLAVPLVVPLDAPFEVPFEVSFCVTVAIFVVRGREFLYIL